MKNMLDNELSAFFIFNYLSIYKHDKQNKKKNHQLIPVA